MPMTYYTYTAYECADCDAADTSSHVVVDEDGGHVPIRHPAGWSVWPVVLCPRCAQERDRKAREEYCRVTGKPPF